MSSRKRHKTFIFKEEGIAALLLPIYIRYNPYHFVGDGIQTASNATGLQRLRKDAECNALITRHISHGAQFRSFRTLIENPIRTTLFFGCILPSSSLPLLSNRSAFRSATRGSSNACTYLCMKDLKIAFFVTSSDSSVMTHDPTSSNAYLLLTLAQEHGLGWTRSCVNSPDTSTTSRFL